MQIKKAMFVRSAADPSRIHMDPPLPEIALVGRSNVGKSSLINTICGQNKLAKVSSTPGKTRLVNFFLVNDAFYLVDLPGYGFANVSRAEKERWGAMIEGYLSQSRQLRHLLLLLDIRHDPTADDKQMAYYLQHYNIPCTIVATKADKLSRSAGKSAAAKLSDKVGMTFRTPTVIVSTQAAEATKQALGSRLDEILAESSQT